MPSPWAQETRTLFRMLSDGEWHVYDEIISQFAATIAPGKALRHYEHRLEYKRQYHNSSYSLSPPSEDEKISRGQRGLAFMYLNGLRRKNLETDGVRGDPSLLIRIKPGADLWKLGEESAEEQAEESAEDAEDREALAEYRAELAAGVLPVPFDSVRDELLADDEATELFEGSGRESKPSESEGVPTYPDEDFSALGPDADPGNGIPVVGVDAPVLGKVTAYEGGERVWQSTYSPERVNAPQEAPVNRTISEPPLTMEYIREQQGLTAEAVREVVRSELAGMLDRFQAGMQDWFSAELDKMVKRVAKPICLGTLPANLPTEPRRPTYRNG